VEVEVECMCTLDTRVVEREKVCMGYLFLYSFTQAMERRMTMVVNYRNWRVKGGDRDRIYGRLATRAFSWREWRKPRTPVRMVGALTKTPTTRTSKYKPDTLPLPSTRFVRTKTSAIPLVPLTTPFSGYQPTCNDNRRLYRERS